MGYCQDSTWTGRVLTERFGFLTLTLSHHPFPCEFLAPYNPVVPSERRSQSVLRLGLIFLAVAQFVLWILRSHLNGSSPVPPITPFDIVTALVLALPYLFCSKTLLLASSRCVRSGCRLCDWSGRCQLDDHRVRGIRRRDKAEADSGDVRSWPSASGPVDRAPNQERAQNLVLGGSFACSSAFVVRRFCRRRLCVHGQDKQTWLALKKYGGSQPYLLP